MRIDRKCNLSDPTVKGIILQEIATSTGMHNISVGPARRRKATQEQFGYYFDVVLPLAKQFLNESQGGLEDGEEVIEYGDKEADIWLKGYLRGRPVFSKTTGEQIHIAIPSKAFWDTKQMFEYTEDVVKLLRDNNVPVPPPDKNYKELRRSMAIGGRSQEAA